MPTKTDKNKRLAEAIDILTIEHDKYSKAAIKPLPALDTNNNDVLEKLLEVVLLRESLSQRTTAKAPESIKLRASIADVILLNDNFDRKLISANAAVQAG